MVRVKAVAPLLAGIRWCGGSDGRDLSEPLRTCSARCGSVAIGASLIDVIDELAVVIRVMKMSFG